MASTLVISPSRGTGLLGADLDRCFEGETLQGQRHGYGRYVYPNKFFTYEGQYVLGKKHGFGRLQLGDGGSYEGQFTDDEIQGEGMRTFANGNKYTGSFQLGEMHGFGSLEMASGDVYEGHFSSNMFNGSGVYKHSCGDVYQGDFSRQQPHGQGVLQAADGTRYQGDWSKGTRNGQGECVFSNGDVYRGQWRDDKMHGEGELLTRRLGVTYKGEFEEGRPAQAAEKLGASFEVEVVVEAGKGGKEKDKGGQPKGTELDALAVIEVLLGQPLPHSIILAALQAAPAPPQRPTCSQDGAPPPPPTPAARRNPNRSQDGGQTATDAPAQPSVQRVYQEQPPPGCCWQDVEQEHGRLVSMTLHAKVSPKPASKPVAVRLGVVAAGRDWPSAGGSSSDGGRDETEGGGVRVRLLVSLQVEASPCLALALTSTGQQVTALEFRLQGGRHVLPQLVMGCAVKGDEWSVSPGGAYTLLFTSPEVAPAQLRVKVGGTEAKAGARKK